MKKFIFKYKWYILAAVAIAAIWWWKKSPSTTAAEETNKVDGTTGANATGPTNAPQGMMVTDLGKAKYAANLK